MSLVPAVAAATSFIFAGFLIGSDRMLVLAVMLAVLGIVFLWTVINRPIRISTTIASGNHTVHMLRPYGDRVAVATVRADGSGRGDFVFYVLPRHWFVTDVLPFVRSSGSTMKVAWKGRPYISLASPLASVRRAQ